MFWKVNACTSDVVLTWIGGSLDGCGCGCG